MTRHSPFAVKVVEASAHVLVVEVNLLLLELAFAWKRFHSSPQSDHLLSASLTVVALFAHILSITQLFTRKIQSCLANLYNAIDQVLVVVCASYDSTAFQLLQLSRHLALHHIQRLPWRSNKSRLIHRIFHRLPHIANLRYLPYEFCFPVCSLIHAISALDQCTVISFLRINQDNNYIKTRYNKQTNLFTGRRDHKNFT